MRENLVGYLLSSLEDEDVRLVEQALKNDAELVQQLHTLSRALVPLKQLKSADPPSPPAGLAVRTCQEIRKLWLSQDRQNRSDILE